LKEDGAERRQGGKKTGRKEDGAERRQGDKAINEENEKE
jgi:hypothetical protein